MLGATFISYRDMQTTQKLQYFLVGFQVLVLVIFAVAAIVQAVNGNAFDASPIELRVVQPLRGRIVQRGRRRPLAVDLHLLGLGRHPHDERGDEEPGEDPGPRRDAHGRSSSSPLYLLIAVALIMFAGVGTGELGLGNEDIQENVFFYLSGPILGPLAFLVSLAVLTSSASSLQSTFVCPARTLLAMGHYGALPPKFAQVSPRFFTPGLRDDRLGRSWRRCSTRSCASSAKTCCGTRSSRSA